MMTSAEVTNNLLSRQKSDRIGLYENVWPDTLQRWEAEGYPKGVPIQNYFHFDINRVGTTFDTAPYPGVRQLIEETSEWITYRNGAGATMKHWKNKSGTPEHIHFEMTSPEIWQRDYRQQLLVPNNSRFSFEQSRQAFQDCRRQGLWVCYNGCFIWETMRQSMGDICMYESLALEPDWIHDFNQTYTDFYIQHFKILFEQVGIPDGVWLSEDLGYKNGLFCSASMLEELFFPYYQQIVDFLHSYKIKVILHSCGNIGQALPFIVKTGFDALHPMERKAGCDPLRFAEQYGDRLAFIGGLDARVLEGGDKAQIKKEIVTLMDGMKQLGASYFFASDHSLSTLVSFDSYQYALSVYEEYKQY